MGRIQKLLFSEYSDFEDMVLLESPFVEITRSGQGLRQVQIGVTASKFIIATEIMRQVKDYPIYFYPERPDPEIESMELISIFPIELLSLSVFQRRRRKVLKARFHDGNPNHNRKVVFYELGGADRRKMFWNLWCEKVRFLNPDSSCYDSGTGSSIASSTSACSLFLTRTRVIGDKVWQYYAGGEVAACPGKVNFRDNWGKQFDNITEMNTVYRRGCDQMSATTKLSPQYNQFLSEASIKVNRFSEGVKDNCTTSLYLRTPGPAELVKDKTQTNNFTDFNEFCESVVNLWERGTRRVLPASFYRFCPFPDFNYCLGVYKTDISGAFNVHMKRTSSLFSVIEERIACSEEWKVTKKLDWSQSNDAINVGTGYQPQTSHDSFLNFWTTDLWYKPDRIKLSLARLRAQEVARSYMKRKLAFLGRRTWKNKGLDFPLLEFRESLKLKGRISIWDLDSNTLAFQLTVIDSQLFLKIPVQEIRALTKQKRGINCANFMAWLIFAHRVTCLVTTQLVGCDSAKTRARLISRFIVVCQKCHRLSNYQSTSSVLKGLQSPAVYRLKTTWGYVRKYHSKVYEIFKELCRHYKYQPLPDLKKAPYLLSTKQICDILFQKPKVQTLMSPVTAAANSVAEGNSPGGGSGAEKQGLSFKEQILAIFNITPAPTLEYHSMHSNFTISDATMQPSTQRSLVNLSEAEKLIKCCHEAVREYGLCGSFRAKEFLLKQPYIEPTQNFELSIQVEKYDLEAFQSQQLI